MARAKNTFTTWTTLKKSRAGHQPLTLVPRIKNPPAVSRSGGFRWASAQLVGSLGLFSANSLAYPLFNGLHQILKVGKDVGIGFVPVFGHHHSINDHIELSMGSRGEFEAAYIFTHPA